MTEIDGYKPIPLTAMSLRVPMTDELLAINEVNPSDSLAIRIILLKRGSNFCVVIEDAQFLYASPQRIFSKESDARAYFAYATEQVASNVD